MQKFFVEENQIEKNTITIIGADVNHIANVLRMQESEKIQICNTQTLENYIVEIKEIEKEVIKTKILEKMQVTTEPNVEIDLYQGLPKADKMELIIQKTTEIGINKIFPVDMIRCVVKLEEKEIKKKIDRWQKIAEAAAKQSKRDKIPQIENKIRLKEILNNIKKYDEFFIAYEEEKNDSLKNVLKSMQKKDYYKIGILIGPEGGIDSKEIEILKQSNVNIISLGKRTLRTETAPIVALANILYELEE